MATNRQIAEQVIAAVNHLGQESSGLYIPDIVKEIPNVIKQFVYWLADNGKPEDRKLFQKDFTVPIVTASGFDTGDLTTALSTAEPMFLHLPFNSVTHPDTQSGSELHYASDKNNLAFEDLTAGFDYYAVEGSTIYVSADPELTGNLTIRSFYFPSMSNIKPQFEQEIVTRLVAIFGMARGVKKK